MLSFRTVMNKTETELREIIRDMCRISGRESVAEALAVSPQYISMILHPTEPRSISASIAERLGYTRESAKTVIFVPKNNSQSSLTGETKSVTVRSA